MALRPCLSGTITKEKKHGRAKAKAEEHAKIETALVPITSGTHGTMVGTMSGTAKEAVSQHRLAPTSTKRPGARITSRASATRALSVGTYI